MNTNKKIMFIIPRMGGGGAERVVANIANTLSDKDYEVKIITLISKESFYPLNKNITINSSMFKIDRSNKIKTYASLGQNFLKALFFIRKEIKKFKPDTVISMLIETDILTYLVKKTGLRFNHICSERNDPTKRSKYLQTLLIHIYKNADHFVCQSKKVAGFYSDINRNKISIIPNPIDTSLIPTSAKESESSKIVAVGRLDTQKNFTLLIDSFYDINQELPESKLTIYGEGPLRKKLEKQISSYKLDKKIFLPGAKKDVLNEIKNSSLFVMSSDFEGFPNALAEAMCLGLPVVSTNFPTGVAEELISEKNGEVVPLNDRHALGRAIVNIMSDYDTRKDMRAENRKLMKKLDSENVVNKWKSII